MPVSIPRLALSGTAIALALGLAGGADARNTTHMFPIADVLKTAVAKEKLGTNIRFYFAGQDHPAVAATFGEHVTNLKTNAFNKSDREACDWVFLGALVSLRDRAVKEGGNAVVGIKSFYRKNEVSNASEYECHAGAVIAGVALKGTVVKLVE